LEDIDENNSSSKQDQEKSTYGIVDPRFQFGRRVDNNSTSNSTPDSDLPTPPPNVNSVDQGEEEDDEENPYQNFDDFSQFTNNPNTNNGNLPPNPNMFGVPSGQQSFIGSLGGDQRTMMMDTAGVSGGMEEESPYACFDISMMDSTPTPDLHRPASFQFPQDVSSNNPEQIELLRSQSDPTVTNNNPNGGVVQHQSVENIDNLISHSSFLLSNKQFDQSRDNLVLCLTLIEDYESQQLEEVYHIIPDSENSHSYERQDSVDDDMIENFEKFLLYVFGKKGKIFRYFGDLLSKELKFQGLSSNHVL